ncbi:MAG: DUF4345 domain-containing protein [Acidiferrobacterales bacterium]
MINYQKAYLWISAIGLIPVALSYGVVPELSMNWLFGITVEVPNEAHIFRGVMGLYLALVTLWILGATNENYERAAILSEIFFMSGLAVGRLLSVLVDGWPHWLLAGYIVVEAILAVAGIILLKQGKAVSQRSV